MKKVSINTLYIEDDYIVKRATYRDRIYIYVYKKSFRDYYQVVALRVIFNE